MTEQEPSTTYAPEYAPVLVAVLNNPSDLRRAQEEGWYRIPLKRAPRRIAAEYLAFYQTSAFGLDGCAVNYFAPVRRFRILTRAELLPDEPDHPRAGDLYYKIEIGPMQRLARPVSSERLRRVTFVSTTLGRLLAAQEFNDLWLRDDLQERLWAALCEAGLVAEHPYQLGEPSGNALIDFALFCRDGRVAVLCETAAHAEQDLRERRPQEYELTASGWRVLTFSGRELEVALQACVAQIVAAVDELGGQPEGPE
jgi:very-short-patch-repair endonuclease